MIAILQILTALIVVIRYDMLAVVKTVIDDLLANHRSEAVDKDESSDDQFVRTIFSGSLWRIKVGAFELPRTEGSAPELTTGNWGWSARLQ